jgi:hypothetical protein
MILNAVLKEGFLIKTNNESAKGQLDVFRILVALFALVSFTILLIDYQSLLHPNGIIPWEVSQANLYWFEFHLKTIGDALSISYTTILWTAVCAYYISLIALLLGIASRLAAISSFLCYYLLTNAFSYFGYGVDVYLNVCFFFLAIFPIGYHFALYKGKTYDTLHRNTNYALRCLRVYLIITYFSAGWQKAVIPEWWTGSFLFEVMQDPTLCTLPLNDTFKQSTWFFRLSSWAVLFSELCYPFAVWIPGLRSAFLLSIILMHCFIIFFLSMPFFGCIMILLNISCFYPQMAADFAQLQQKIKTCTRK